MSSEIDLHGFDTIAAIDVFVNYYNDRVKSGDFGNINVIHGYGATGGEGKIRGKLRSFLAAHSDCLSFQGGENLDFHNLGETVVFPKKVLPSAIDLLSEEILDYCQIPKTKTKIVGKFRMHGETKILASIQYLEKRKLLIAIIKGKHKLYQRCVAC
ncbi:MAG: Smr/MutS family protein [Candidatus Riflebacteria bacterium]|nr:Smr/MutS family protein [Candidatus Riflebacteria bacterium]